MYIVVSSGFRNYLYDLINKLIEDFRGVSRIAVFPDILKKKNMYLRVIYSNVKNNLFSFMEMKLNLNQQIKNSQQNTISTYYKRIHLNNFIKNTKDE